MQGKKNIATIQGAFRSNPALNTLYMTADGILLKTAEAATNHAKNLVKRATPDVMPAAGTPQLVNAQAAIKAAAIVSPITRERVMPSADSSKQGQTADGGTQAAATGVPGAVTQLTKAEAEAALTAAQNALTAAKGVMDEKQMALDKAKKAKSLLPANAPAKDKGDAQKAVNTAAGDVAEATTVYENAQVDALAAEANVKTAI